MIDAEINPPVLGYSIDQPRHQSKRYAVVAMLLTLPAAASNFLPFAYGVAPIQGYGELHRLFSSGDALAALAIGFSSAFPLIFLQARQLIPRRAALIEQIFYPVVAAFFALPALCVNGYIAYEIATQKSTVPIFAFVIFGLCVAVLAWGALLTIVNFRRRPVAALSVLSASAYASNAGLGLMSFYEEPQVGYWISACAVAALLYLMAIESIALRRLASNPGI